MANHIISSHRGGGSLVCAGSACMRRTAMEIAMRSPPRSRRTHLTAPARDRSVQTEGKRLSLTHAAGIVPLMSDVVSPFPTWLTYQQVAERLGLRSASAAAARARRAKWPRRIRNDTLQVEVCVPAEVLAAGPL